MSNTSGKAGGLKKVTVSKRFEFAFFHIDDYHNPHLPVLKTKTAKAKFVVA